MPLYIDGRGLTIEQNDMGLCVDLSARDYDSLYQLYLHLIRCSS